MLFDLMHIMFVCYHYLYKLLSTATTMIDPNHDWPLRPVQRYNRDGDLKLFYYKNYYSILITNK
jgi:hypothetical protein